jgi:hypothetical protein
MSHFSWRSFSPADPARSTARAITWHELHMRPLAMALFSSLCLMFCFAAAAQAAPQPEHDPRAVLTNKEVAHASTAPRSTVAVAAACGFNLIGVSAYYNHCGPTWVCIRVLTRGADYDKMVPAWRNTYLGSHSWVEWAYYVRPNCFG